MAETKKLNQLGLTQVWSKIVTLFATKDDIETLNTGIAQSFSGIENTLGETQVEVAGKADKSTTLSGYGITDAYTKAEADSAISEAITGTIGGIYKVKGSITFAELPTEGVSEGWVYNVTDVFTTTEGFLEGAGTEYPAGTNVVWTEDGWDCMSGTYDFSEYMKSADLVDITEAEIDEICVLPEGTESV